MFVQYLPEAQMELRELHSSATGADVMNLYVNLVLFPETFIFHLECEGRTRTEAENEFKRIEITNQEIQVLTQFVFGNLILF